ncbi:hypothetical protein C8R47DRAFT_1226578 [Mycena vitilis]|nr:hypothetical protein C8R47DRAFT_1226578 [Mycena vitilis]
MAMLKQLIASNPGMQVTPRSPLHSLRKRPSTVRRRVHRWTSRNWICESAGPRAGTGRRIQFTLVKQRLHWDAPEPQPATVAWCASHPQECCVTLGNQTPPTPPSKERCWQPKRLSRSEGAVSASPSAFGRGPPGRMRTPSNATSPSSSMNQEFSPPPSARSRPPSRGPGAHAHVVEEDFDYTLRQGLSSLPMPRGSDSDSDSDDGHGADMVMDRSAASSTASMMPHERVEALQCVNDDLARKLQDTERTMQRKLAEQEAEFEDLQVKLEETRNELSAAKREEKQLRSKERQNNTQMRALDAELQYLDQCARAEKYRDDLRDREESVREASGLTLIELARYAKEHEGYEDRIAHLEQELSVAQQAHAQLDEQKQENMMLKEDDRPHAL